MSPFSSFCLIVRRFGPGWLSECSCNFFLHLWSRDFHESSLPFFGHGTQFNQGLNSCSLRWKRGVLATGLPGKSQGTFMNLCLEICHNLGWMLGWMFRMHFPVNSSSQHLLCVLVTGSWDSGMDGCGGYGRCPNRTQGLVVPVVGNGLSVMELMTKSHREALLIGTWENI